MTNTANSIKDLKEDDQIKFTLVWRDRVSEQVVSRWVIDSDFGGSISFGGGERFIISWTNVKRYGNEVYLGSYVRG